jgi:proteasome lid subunit RPN8/RPN11
MGACADMAKSKPKSVTCVVDSEVIRKIRQHARSHMKTEVCGVLIGNNREGAICVDEIIAGLNAAQAGSHVTFTQDTWEHVYKIKDKEFPEARIVGWYHSHPGFGVFLSEHDTFIHQNFFSAEDQIAWVYDPHSDEEGCFGWVENRIKRIASIRISDARGGEPAETVQKHESIAGISEEEHEEAGHFMEERSTAPWARWTVTILTHVLALFIGLLVAWFVFPRLVVVGVAVDPQTGRPIADPGIDRPGVGENQSRRQSLINNAEKEQHPDAPTIPQPDAVKGNDAHAR